MLRQKDNDHKNQKYVDAMKVLSVQEANEKNEKELNNMKAAAATALAALPEPGNTNITVEIDNGYVSKPATFRSSAANVSQYDGDPAKVSTNYLLCCDVPNQRCRYHDHSRSSHSSRSSVSLVSNSFTMRDAIWRP